MYSLDYAFRMHWKQFEILPLGLASKLGLHPVAIAHLSPGTSSLLRVHECYTYFHPCIMDMRKHLQLSLAARGPFLLWSRP
jgi:hypothetical protein